MLRPRSLLTLAIALVVLAVAILSVEYGRITREFYSRMVQSEGRSVRDRLNLRLSPPVAALSMTARLLSRAAPDRPTPQDARDILLSALADEHSLDAATLMDSHGVAAMAARSGEGFLYYQRPGSSGSPAVWQKLGPDLALLGDGPDASADASSQQSVIEAALKEDHASQPVWTTAHSLPGRHAAAVSVVLQAGPDGGQSRALAFSFALDRTLEALRQGLPDDARIVVCSPGGNLLDPGDVGRVGPHAAFVPTSQAGDPVLAGAVRTWQERSMPLGEAFGFQVSGRAWWASLQPLYEGDAHTYAGLAISREELVSLVWRGNRAVVAVAVSLMAAIILLAVLLVVIRRRSHPGPKPFFETPQSVLELLGQGEGDRLEFKSTLRFNLAAGKPGKEIELAVLKTVTAFLNTDGGVLAVGVDDQGRMLGLDADGFENDDHLLRHFSSLFAQHVGVEHLRDVTFALREVEGRKVLLVECSKSKEPVILKTGKEEEFYVRAGPSSRRLSLSEFMRRVTGKDAGSD